MSGFFCMKTFLLGAILSMLISRRQITPKLRCAVALLTFAYYVMLQTFMPYLGYISDAVIATVGACVIALAFTFFRRDFSYNNIWSVGPVFLTVIIIMVSVCDRVNMDERIPQSCDGTVIEKTRTNGETGAPVLVVSSTSGSVRLEAVEYDLWNRATFGKHLIKQSGSAFATLDGERLKLVNTTIFYNDSFHGDIRLVILASVCYFVLLLLIIITPWLRG